MGGLAAAAGLPHFSSAALPIAGAPTCSRIVAAMSLAFAMPSLMSVQIDVVTNNTTDAKTTKAVVRIAAQPRSRTTVPSRALDSRTVSAVIGASFAASEA